MIELGGRVRFFFCSVAQRSFWGKAAVHLTTTLQIELAKTRCASGSDGSFKGFIAAYAESTPSHRHEQTGQAASAAVSAVLRPAPGQERPQERERGEVAMAAVALVRPRCAEATVVHRPGPAAPTRMGRVVPLHCRAAPVEPLRFSVCPRLCHVHRYVPIPPTSPIKHIVLTHTLVRKTQLAS